MKKLCATFLLVLFCSLPLICFNVLPAYAAGDEWSSKAPMPTARSALGTVAVDGKIYAIGGDGIQAQILNANEQYDPASNTWTTKAPMPTPRSYCAIAACQGKIYCIGGFDTQNVTGVNEVYDPITDAWTTKSPLPIQEAFVTAQSVGGKIYCFGNNFTLVYDPSN